MANKKERGPRLIVDYGQGYTNLRIKDRVNNQTSWNISERDIVLLIRQLASIMQTEIVVKQRPLDKIQLPLGPSNYENLLNWDMLPLEACKFSEEH